MFHHEMDSLDLGVAPDLLFSEGPLISTDLLNDHVCFDLDTSEAFGPEMAGSELDMLTVAGKPSDVTGQSLVSHMEDDKLQVLQQMSMMSAKGGRNHLGDVDSSFASSTQMWLVDSEDAGLGLDAQQPVKMEASVGETDASMDETQSFIDELQDFMDSYERQNSSQDMPQEDVEQDLIEQLLTEKQQETLEGMEVSECPLANSTLTDEESVAAELMLDALLKGDITTSDDFPVTDFPTSVSQTMTDDSGYHSFNASNVTEILTEDGRKVIIVVAPEDQSQDVKVFDAQNFDQAPGAVSFTAASTSTIKAADVLPQSRFSVSDSESLGEGSDDSDWTPDSPAARKSIAKRKPGRKPEARLEGVTAGKVTKLSTTIKDKKERKKQQNVEAARRYRDKKKSEQQVVEGEEKELMDKNKELKGRFAEIESEVKTLKKLMSELGLIKLMQRK